jgi:WD40 repeat protein
MQLWDVATGRELHRIGCSQGQPTATFTPDGKGIMVLTGYDLEVWEVRSGGLRWRAENPLRWAVATRTAFSPDGRSVAVIGAGGRVTLRDLKSGAEIDWYVACNEREGVGFSSTGRFIAWTWEGPHLQIRDRKTDRLLTPIRALRFDPTGRSLHALNEMAHLTTWDVGRRMAVREAELRRRGDPNDMDNWDRESGVYFSPRGDRLVISGTGGTSIVFDTRTGREILSVRPPLDTWKTTWRAEFVADGSQLAWIPHAYQGNTSPAFIYTLVDARDGKERHRADLDPDGSIGGSWDAAAVSPDGRYAAVLTAWDHRFLTWDLTARKPLADARIDGENLPGTALDVAPDSRTALLIFHSGEMQWRDLISGRLLRSVQGRKAAKHTAVFSPDGRTFAVVAGEGDEPTTMSVYERITGRERSVRTFPRQEVTALTYSPDGSTLATGHDDGTVLLWPTAGRAPGRAIEQLWLDLHADARTAGLAIDELAARPCQAEVLFRAKLRRDQLAPLSVEQVRRWIASLTAADHGERQEAITCLAGLRFAVEPALRAAEREGDLESRLRCRRLLAALDHPTQKEIAQTRFVEVLERIGATEMLEELGRGDPGSALTREAKASLARLHLRR